MESNLVGMIFITFGLILAWEFMIKKLLHRLKHNHKSVFISLGGDDLLINKSSKNGWLLLKWLFSLKWRNLNDLFLSVYCPFLMFFVVVLTIMMILFPVSVQFYVE